MPARHGRPLSILYVTGRRRASGGGSLVHRVAGAERQRSPSRSWADVRFAGASRGAGVVLLTSYVAWRRSWGFADAQTSHLPAAAKVAGCSLTRDSSRAPGRA